MYVSTYLRMYNIYSPLRMYNIYSPLPCLKPLIIY